MTVDSSDGHADPPSGVVELREDVPLKAGAGGGAGGAGRCCGGGPRFIVACFALLSAAITLALLTQIYYGDYELVPHGSVSSDAAACSRAGTDALKAGGSALDAAAAAVLCLALLAPHRTSLDASGSMLLWEYRRARSTPPVVVEWGGAGARGGSGAGGERAPRLVAALAGLHAVRGRLPWPRLLDPVIALARNGYPVSEGLAAAAAERAAAASAVGGAGSVAGSVAAGELAGDTRTSPLLADYLETLQLNSSAQLSAAWADASNAVRTVEAGAAAVAGAWRLHAAGAGVLVVPAIAAALQTDTDPDAGFLAVVNALQKLTQKGWAPSGVSSGLAVVDRDDTYIALVTGLTVPFGSGPTTPEGWVQDDPPPGATLDLAPAIMFQDDICGTRYVIGAESSAALAQAAVAVALGGAGAAAGAGALAGAGAVEGARVGVQGAGVLALEAGRPPPAGLPALLLVNASRPYPAVNVVQQTADRLLSHADSRGGGLASRF